MGPGFESLKVHQKQSSVRGLFFVEKILMTKAGKT